MHLAPLLEMQRVLSWFAGPPLTTEPTSIPLPPSSADAGHPSPDLPGASLAGRPDLSMAANGRLVFSEVKTLFGGSAPWNCSRVTWHAVDDRVRGGSSQSYLTSADNGSSNGSAIFSGTLDTQTLGGAGFASQSTIVKSNSTSSDEDDSEAATWDLEDYDGLRVVVGKGDTKKYTLTLKDEIPGKREDGREKSGVSWESVFDGPGGKGERMEEAGKEVWMPWSGFEATYRGRPKEDPEPLKKGCIRQFGLMMRSFFEEQEGEFELEIKSIEAVKK